MIADLKPGWYWPATVLGSYWAKWYFVVDLQGGPLFSFPEAATFRETIYG
ncbi:MAG: hypothetical protein JSW55_05440 [Chloroflexota bacterium]|nr:MAG: hypothetical protein JSW55_05440 [Chloroflexota bacterium]